MVTVYRGQNWKLAVYGRDHGVPHFHIEGPGYRCSIAIETGVFDCRHGARRRASRRASVGERE
jgi:hypothetical protein